MNFKHSAKWYVYELSDPRDNKVFYVGKGTGSRIDHHERETLKGVCSKKCNKIRSLINSGVNIHKSRIALFWDEQAAYDYETEVIAGYGLENLTNIMAGGQKAFERRVKELKVRKKKEETHYQIFKKSINTVVHWLKLTEGGKYKVTSSAPIIGNKFYDMIPALSEKLYNDIIGKFFNELISNQEDRKNVINDLRAYNINLEFSNGSA